MGPASPAPLSGDVWLLIDSGSDLLNDLTQRLGGGFDRGDIFTLGNLLHFSDFGFDFRLDLRRHFIAKFLQRFFSRIDRVIRVVARFDQFLALAIFFRMGLRHPCASSPLQLPRDRKKL